MSLDLAERDPERHFWILCPALYSRETYGQHSRKDGDHSHASQYTECLLRGDTICLQSMKASCFGLPQIAEGSRKGVVSGWSPTRKLLFLHPCKANLRPSIFESINRKSANYRVKRQIHEESYLTKTATPLCGRLPAISSLAFKASKECATPAALAV